ncbi:hypothetical protein K488DRAFT_86638 [Vararia minispora EC-137]|uniref:Uncharacterized protein n=1 Tax=Vararia minispora EC-137 TaxID=1314806 RepID=A0ACB8QIF2_9AGAM|nr:hypothetical protein K488DRAFT_86638 [Vararia minispora EC-137]
MNRTVNMVQRLIMIVVNTGLLTAVATITTLCLVSTRLAFAIMIDRLPSSKELAYPQSVLWYGILGLPTYSLYFSGFLANLNARNYVRGEGGLVVTLSNFEAVAPSQSTSGTNVRDPASISRQVGHLVLRKSVGGSHVNIDSIPGGITVDTPKRVRIASDEGLECDVVKIGHDTPDKEAI